MEKENRRLLFVDDDREILKIFKGYFEKKGYSAETCPNGQDALDFLRNNEVHCIVLDVMMPETDGFELLSEIKKLTDAPVLFLSGMTDDKARIRGLSLGADDYINKPCSLEELELRVEINLRKSLPSMEMGKVMEISPLMISPAERKVFFRDKEIPLSNREVELLMLFAENPGRTLTYEEIGTSVNGSYITSDRQSVMMAVSRLRKKLEVCAHAADVIETVWGEGYRVGRTS